MIDLDPSSFSAYLEEEPPSKLSRDRSIQLETYRNENAGLKEDFDAESYQVYLELLPFTAIPLYSTHLTREVCKQFFELMDKINALIPDHLIKQHLIRLDGGRKLKWKSYKETSVSLDAFRLRRLHECFEMLSIKYEGGVAFDALVAANQFVPAHHKAVKIEMYFFLAQARVRGKPLSKNTLEFIRVYDEYEVRAYSGFWSGWETQRYKNHEFRSVPNYYEMKAYVEFMIESKQWANFKRNGDVPTDHLMSPEVYAWSKWLYFLIKKDLNKDTHVFLKYLILKAAKGGFYTLENIKGLADSLRNYCQTIVFGEYCIKALDNRFNFGTLKDAEFCEDIMDKNAKFSIFWNHFKNYARLQE